MVDIGAILIVASYHLGGQIIIRNWMSLFYCHILLLALGSYWKARKTRIQSQSIKWHIGLHFFGTLSNIIAYINLRKNCKNDFVLLWIDSIPMKCLCELLNSLKSRPRMLDPPRNSPYFLKSRPRMVDPPHTVQNHELNIQNALNINVDFYLNLMNQIQESFRKNEFKKFANTFIQGYQQ